MLKRFYVTNEDTPLSKLFQEMSSKDIKVVPVLRDSKVIGLITLEQVGKYYMIFTSLRKPS